MHATFPKTANSRLSMHLSDPNPSLCKFILQIFETNNFVECYWRNLKAQWSFLVIYPINNLLNFLGGETDSIFIVWILLS